MAQRPMGHSGERDQSGVTLVEVVVSLLVFGLVALAGAAMLSTGIRVSANSRDRSQATTLASNAIELIRNNASFPCAWQHPMPSTCNAAAAVVPVAVTTTTQTVGAETYTIKQTTEFEAKATPQNACNASTQGGSAGVQPVLLVTEAVTWHTMGGTPPIKSQTILTPPIGAFSSNTGAIDVGIVNSLNQPDSGIPVTVTNPSGVATFYTSDDNGCVLAAFLVPGAYTVSISQLGYVDNQEHPTSTQALAVTTGNVTTATFFFDRATTLSATFVPAASWPSATTFGYPTDLPVTVANTGISGLGTYLLPNGSAGSPVYPYSSGYAIWAGRCPEANPEAVKSGNATLYPVPPSGNSPAPTTVTTAAGQMATAALPLYPLTINVTDAASKPVSFSVTEAAGASVIPCGAPFKMYTLPGTAPGNPTTAQTYVVGLPLGNFTLQATDGSSSKTINNVNVGLNGATATVAL